MPDPVEYAELRAALHTRIENDLTLHPPAGVEVGVKMDATRAAYKQLAHSVIEWCPPSRELSLALTNLEESLFYAVASLARYQPAPSDVG